MPGPPIPPGGGTIPSPPKPPGPVQTTRPLSVPSPTPPAPPSGPTSSGPAGSGQTGSGQSQPFTPYGGVYPQPSNTGGFSAEEAPGLLSTTSALLRPENNIRTCILTSGSIANGVTAWTTSGIMPVSFTIQDVVIITDVIQSLSTVRFGTSKGNVVDGPTADMANNLIMGSSATAPSTQRLTIPCGFVMIPIYGLNFYVNDVGTRLWMEFLNGDASNRNCMVMFNIVIEPGSESIPTMS